MKTGVKVRKLFSKLLAIAALALAGVAHAQASEIDVVKIMNFGCPYCRAAESIDGYIKQEVEASGGKFVWAPVPVLKDDSGLSSEAYYAARDIDPAFGEAFKTSMYKATQDMQIALNTQMDIYTWIQQDLPQYSGDFQKLFQLAAAPKAEKSVALAFRIAQQAGVSDLPGYVFLKDGQVVGLVDRTSAGGGSPSQIRLAVMKELNQLQPSH